MDTMIDFITKHTIKIFWSGWIVMIGNLALMAMFMPRCPSGQADFFWYFCGLTLMMIGLMMVILPLMLNPPKISEDSDGT